MEYVLDSGLIITKPVIYIPEKILKVCRKLAKRFVYYEFSILCKGKWTERGFELSEEYAIPRQEVTAYNVKYNNKHVAELIAKGFNTVIHKHPDGMTRFSPTDEDFINANFTASILFTDDEFVKAIINISFKKGWKLQVDAEIKVKEKDEIEVKDIENIKPKPEVDISLGEQSINFRGWEYGFSFGDEK